MSEKVLKLIEEVKVLSVLELSELVKALEEVFGVSASAPTVVAAAPVAGVAGGQEAAVSEKTEFDVVLTAAGDSKIKIVKAIKDITNMTLKDAKDIVDNVPKTVKEKLPKDKAEEIKKKLEEAGAKVEIK